MYIDTHTHVNLPEFNDDSSEVIARALKENIWMINVGTGLETSRLAVELAKKNPVGVFAAVGVHPTDFEESFDEEVYSQMLTDKVVAVGECGLDYYRLTPENRETEIQKQKTEFVKQLHFAQKNSLPVIIHCRDAYEDLLEILKAEYKGTGVIHSFTDSYETAKKFLDVGFYIALNGILTFDKSGKLAEVVEKVPMDKLLTETDAPYLAPPPYRGKRNEPAYVKYVVEKIAEIKKMTAEEVGQKTFENACELFGVKRG